MKRLFWLISVLMVATVLAKANSCFADRFMTDPLFSSAPIIDSDSKAKSQEGSDSDEDATQKPDPFAAERQVVLKGTSSSTPPSAKKAATDVTSDKSGADKSAKPLVSDHKPDAGIEKNDSASKDSSGSSSKKQPSMYYYQ